MLVRIVDDDDDDDDDVVICVVVAGNEDDELELFKVVVTLALKAALVVELVEFNIEVVEATEAGTVVVGVDVVKFNNKVVGSD